MPKLFGVFCRMQVEQVNNCTMRDDAARRCADVVGMA